MGKNDLNKLERKLRQKIEAAIKAGSFMNNGDDVGLDYTTPTDPSAPVTAKKNVGVCLLGAVLLGQPYQKVLDRDHVSLSAEVLGLNEFEVLDLETGYADFSDEACRHQDLFELGHRLRREFFGGDQHCNNPTETEVTE